LPKLYKYPMRDFVEELVKEINHYSPQISIEDLGILMN